MVGQGQGMFDCSGGLFIDSMSNMFVVDRMNHSKLTIFLKFFLMYLKIPHFIIPNISLFIFCAIYPK